jgi:hypothetical protein
MIKKANSGWKREASDSQALNLRLTYDRDLKLD